MINRKNGNDWGANNSLCSFIATLSIIFTVSFLNRTTLILGIIYSSLKVDELIFLLPKNER